MQTTRLRVFSVLAGTAWLAFPVLVARAYDPPTPPEQAAFDAKRARIVANVPGVQAGREVADVLGAFDAEKVITKPCPEGSTANSVTVKINAKLKKWDAATVEAKIGKGKVGACFADYTQSVTDGMKTILFDYTIMLDPAVTGPDELDVPMGQLVDETLLYHELLHCQLLTNAILSDAAWLQTACNCTVDLAPLDADHGTIFGWEEAYLELIAGAQADVHVRRPAAQTAKDADGNFADDLGELPECKNALSGSYRVLEQSNVTNVSLCIGGEPGCPASCPQGHVCVVGKLVDPKKPGFVLVRFDPPSCYLYAGIEDGVQIDPFPIPIPALDAPRIVLVCLLLGGIGGLAGVRRARARR